MTFRKTIKLRELQKVLKENQNKGKTQRNKNHCQL